MNEKIKNAWEYVKEHKMQIALTALTAIGGVVLFKTLSSKNVSAMSDAVQLPVEIESDCTGLVEGITQFDDLILEVNKNYTLPELGKLGEDIRESFPDISDDINVWGLFGYDKNET